MGSGVFKMRRKAYGRAFKITANDAKSYDWVKRPRGRGLKPNPIGVTTLAQVNGRGAYSARKATNGLSPSERVERARKILGASSMRRNGGIKVFRRNAAGGRAKFLRRNAKKTTSKAFTPRLKPPEVIAAEKAELAAAFAAREAYIGRASKEGSKSRAKAAPAKAAPAKARKKKTYAGQYEYRTVKAKRRVRAKYGPYKPVNLYDPNAGKTRQSFMYRSKSGRLRRIPLDYIIGEVDKKGNLTGEVDKKLLKRAMDRRGSASKRVMKHGDAFVANRRSKMRKRKGRRRSMSRNTPPPDFFNMSRRVYKRSDKTWQESEGGGSKIYQAKMKARKLAERKARKLAARKARKRKTTKTKRKMAAAGAAPRMAAKRRRGKGKSKTRAGASKRKSAKRKGKGKRLKSNRRRRYGRRLKSNRRRRYGRRLKANGRRRRGRGRRRSMRRNQFMSHLLNVLKIGALITGGVVAHRVLTNLVNTYVAPKVLPQDNATLATWQKAISGTVVLVAGVAATNALPLSSDKKLNIGGGMVGSWLLDLIVTGLKVAKQESAASYLAGYENSRAYLLRNRRRGMGAFQSLMPKYAPVGAFQQASAGMGEYFAPNRTRIAAGMGEYFAPSGLQGVGAYEAAGPLAMQAAAGVAAVDDGIRPDANLDRVLDLAEAAAGLHGPRRRAMGEYYTAAPSNGGYAESVVPQDSQWIPNGPLWAGTMSAGDSQSSSEIPAGILATAGGNGTLSG